MTSPPRVGAKASPIGADESQAVPGPGVGARFSTCPPLTEFLLDVAAAGGNFRSQRLPGRWYATSTRRSIAAEPAPTAGRQPQGARFVGFDEVVDEQHRKVAVGRRLDVRDTDAPLHICPSLPAPGRRDYSLMRDADVETYRLNGPSLTDDTGQVFQIGCGVK